MLSITYANYFFFIFVFTLRYRKARQDNPSCFIPCRTFKSVRNNCRCRNRGRRRHHRLHDRGRRDNRRRGDDGRRRDNRSRCDHNRRRRDKGRTDDTPDYATDEPRPEVAATPAPIATMVVVMVMPTAMMMYRRTMTSPTTMMMESVRASQAGARTQNSGESRENLDFLIHVSPLPFRLFGVYIPVGM